MSDLPKDIPWHRSINAHMDTNFEEMRFMYEAKTLASELPRIARLIQMERDGQLPKVYKHCSRSEEVEVAENFLTCALGKKLRDCPHLKALESIEGATPEQTDMAKAWTCGAHIVSEGGDISGEGYVIRVDDRMFWEEVYANLATVDEEP